jgi:hypothetical protein
MMLGWCNTAAHPHPLFAAAASHCRKCRDFIFPFRLRGGKPTPFTVWLMATVFCLYNGWMQTRFILCDAPAVARITDRTLAGAVVWLAGWCINLEADHILINLRKPGETGGCQLLSSPVAPGRCHPRNSALLLAWLAWALGPLRPFLSSLPLCFLVLSSFQGRPDSLLLDSRFWPARLQGTRSHEAAPLSWCRRQTTLERYWSGAALPSQPTQARLQVCACHSLRE